MVVTLIRDWLTIRCLVIMCVHIACCVGAAAFVMLVAVPRVTVHGKYLNQLVFVLCFCFHCSMYIV